MPYDPKVLTAAQENRIEEIISGRLSRCATEIQDETHAPSHVAYDYKSNAALRMRTAINCVPWREQVHRYARNLDHANLKLTQIEASRNRWRKLADMATGSGLGKVWDRDYTIAVAYDVEEKA